MEKVKVPSFSGISWPTISLFLTTAIIYWFTLDFGDNIANRCWKLALHAICCYAQFTVMHDAGHGSISTLRSQRWINDLFGWLSQVWMGPTANFYAFRHIHSQHHKYTNNPKLDPDYWVSHSPHRFNFLKWFLVDVGYYYFYIPQVWPFGWPWKASRPKKEIMIVWCYHLAIIVLLVCSIKFGFFGFLWWNWILPSRLSKFLLAFFFDFLPHCNIFTTEKEDRYHTTRYLDFSWWVRPLATLALCYHNYHIAHHLWPSNPWWFYKSAFLTNEHHLVEEKKIYSDKLL